MAVVGAATIGTPETPGTPDIGAAASPVPDASGCHAGAVPAAALPEQPRSVLCRDLGAGPGTAISGQNEWSDAFDHGLAFADFEGTDYVTAVVGAPGRTAFWRHADHWMVDIAPGGAGTAGAFVRPDRSFRFDDSTFVVEMVTAAGHADYAANAWPEIVVTTGAEPTDRRPDGLYAYDHFPGHTTLGCRLQAERVPVCSLFNNTTNGVDGGRLWEISFFQQAGDVTFGGGPWVDDTAWRTCDADDDPDSLCRDRFRLELTPTSLTLIVNDVRYFAQSGLPEMPADFVKGDLYVYAASMLWRNPDDVVRFHWDDLIVKLMLKWPGLHYSTSAFAPKYYPQSIIDYANTRGADKIIYAGYFPMGLSLERIMGDMQHVPFKDEVWPKFLRDNAARILKVD